MIKLHLKLSNKILIYFLLVSLLPLVVAMYFLVDSANKLLLEEASSKQQAVAGDLTDKVDNYLAAKAKSLEREATIYSTNQRTSNQIDQNLAVLLDQDKDIQRVAFLNADGMEMAVFNRDGKVSKRTDQSKSEVFKAVNFFAGKNYVSSVTYTDKNVPTITIAVPVLKSDFVGHLSDLPAADFGTYAGPDDIRGALVAQYDTSDIWQSVLSTKIGDGGYAYVVDGFGNLVAHPDPNFLTSNQQLGNVQAVKEFTSGNSDTNETISETGQSVISTPRVIKSSGWAVIVEEPVSSIYSGIYSFIRLSVYIGISALALTIIMSVFFRRQLIEPLNKLSTGAKRIASGKFDEKIELNSKDELQELADTFNKMSSDINKLVHDLQANNDNLRIEQDKLSNIIESVSDGIIALDATGKIVSINPPAAQLISTNPVALKDQIMAEQFHWEVDGKPFAPELAKPGLYHYSNLNLTQGGHTAYLDLMVSVLDNKDNDVTSIITIHDLTQSRELDFMKLDFVAIAAHELRTPLTVVAGYLDMLNQAVSKKLTIFDIENLQKAITGSTQLRDLINKLLNIARIERGEMDLFIEKVDINGLIAANVNQHKTAAGQKQQALVYQTNEEGPVYVPADPSSLTEVLNNLIGNAIKFTNKDGSILVTLRIRDDNVVVKVADNGPGVPSELRKRLFTKFYRAERSLISGTRGTGLGLFISKTIIEKQSGEIGIMPDKGHGSVFYFTLPIYNPAKHDTLVTRDKHTGGIRGWFKKRTDR